MYCTVLYCTVSSPPSHLTDAQKRIPPHGTTREKYPTVLYIQYHDL